MNLEMEDRGTARLVTVKESRVDAAVAVTFKERMRELTGGHTGRVVLDMGQVGFLDSSGLGAVVGAMKQLEPGATLELAALTQTVERVFRLTRMDSVFAIHPTADDAIAAGESAA